MNGTFTFLRTCLNFGFLFCDCSQLDSPSKEMCQNDRIITSLSKQPRFWFSSQHIFCLRLWDGSSHPHNRTFSLAAVKKKNELIQSPFLLLPSLPRWWCWTITFKVQWFKFLLVPWRTYQFGPNWCINSACGDWLRVIKAFDFLGTRQLTREGFHSVAVGGKNTFEVHFAFKLIKRTLWTSTLFACCLDYNQRLSDLFKFSKEIRQFSAS